MYKYKITLVRDDNTLEPYIFYTYADSDAEAVLLVCAEHSELNDVDSVICEEVGD